MTLSRLLRIAHHRFRSLLRSRTMDEETARELAFHFEQLVREQIEEGVPAEEARHAARRILGSQPRLEEECRDERRSTWLHDLRQDLTYAWRMLRAHRGFTIVAVMSLALGIGANAAILGVIRGVLLDPLPFPDADRIVVIRTLPLDNPQQTQRAQLTDYVAWRDALVAVRDGSSAGGSGSSGSSARAIEAIGVSLVDRRDWGAENDTTPAERLEGQLVSPSMFATLGVPPLVGRVFTDDDGARESDARVIVISHRLWQRRFDSDPRIAGRQVRLNGVSTTIIGVMPPTFRYPDGSDYWVPLRITPRLLQGSARFFGVTARLAPGATIAQADAEVAAVAARLARETPGRSAGWGVRVDSLRETMYGWTRRPLLTLQTAVGLVLVIACVNVAGLLLARGRARAAELALRASLGAGRGRIVRQLLTESLLLSGLGGMLGLIVTWWGLRLSILIVPPPGGVWIAPVEFDLRVAGLIALLSIVTGLAFGIAPAFAATRRDLVQAFSGARGGTHARGATAAAGGRAMWGTLAAAQIALAVILLIGTGLLLHSVIRFALRPLNFEPEGLLTFEYRVPAGDYIRPLAAPANGATFDIVPPPSLMIARIHERLRSIPGTNGVAGIAYTHVNSFIVPTMTLRLEREPGTPSPRLRGEGWGEGYQAAGATRAAYFLITPDLFKTMGAAIVRGRELRDTDASGAPWVAIVNETAARRFWPGLDPIGQRMTVDVVGDEQPREVVGVVRDIPVRRDREAPEPVVYVSYLQQPSRYREPWAGMFGQMYFVVRTSGDPLRLVPAVRQAVAEIDPQRPIANIARVDRQMDIGVQVRGVFTLALGVFAAVAMSLAAIGIYGTLAYAVAQRTREIGIRIALGATRREVLALIGRRAIAVIVAGLIAGLAGALALTRLIASQLWGVTPTDPVTFAGVSLLVASVALLASFAPVRRAMRVDPTIALKHE